MIAAPTIEDPAYFDHLARIEREHWWSDGMWRLSAYWLAQVLRGRRGLRALDLGCGTGLTAVRLASLNAVETVYGLDPSPRALAHARRHPIRLARGTALRIPFPSRSFDLVTCFDVLQHLPLGTDVAAAREIERVLAPGGLALIRCNGRGWWKPSGPGAIPYDLDELRRTIASAGLRIARSTYANCLPALVQELRGLAVLGRLRASSGHPARGGLQIRVPHPAINRVMRHITSAEAILAGRLNKKLPFGHSTLVLAGRGD